eukprot:TRINITY_DN4352_c0_g1_i1.p1 TRINITY_DN4352_c0_g1~~TRINITY_DN4352_c0_g1_i1.p1  ORF type:complete len:719 (-),score=97.88 TRINITY_DN4352_c0_g1_i1:32-2188(-)
MRRGGAKVARSSSSTSVQHNADLDDGVSVMNNKPTNQCSSLDDLLSNLPKDIYELSNRKALAKLLFSAFAIALSVTLLAISPWWLLPLGWLIMGTSITGLFTVGYSCAKDKFFKNPVVNYLVGTLCLLPLMYPMEYWASKAKRARLTVNSAKDELLGFSAKVAASPFWFLSSVVEWIQSNFTFDFSRRMVLSACCLYLFVAIFFPLVTYGVGLWGLFKYYLIPLLVYHFWMSTFLKTSVMGVFGELGLTSNSGANPEIVVFHYPRWVQLLSHDFNYGISLVQNAASSIPTYRWRDAITTLKTELGQKSVPELRFGWKILAGSVPFKNKAYSYDLNKIKIFLKSVAWGFAIFMAVTTGLALYGIFSCPFNWKTYALGFASYYIAGIGITAGYHRLFSHRSYDAVWPVRFVLMLMGSSALEMSVLNWCWDHRAHHRYTDTPKDPYDVTRGFFWAHMGWLLFKRTEMPQSDISDLKKDWVLRLQDKYYPIFAIGTGIVLPTWIAGHYWGDWKGGFLISAVLSKVVMLHCTFFINSLAHYWGEFTYTDQKSPRDSALTSLVTFGEGYHNFHHEFPYDYRNGIRWLSYDPGKWLIYVLSLFGLTYNLKRFPKELFAKGNLQMQQKEIDRKKAMYNWGPKVEQLPKWTREHVDSMISGGHRSLVIFNGVVYDVSTFIDQHPGGRKFLEVNIGKDITSQFNGSVYNHSHAARNIIDTLAVAVFLN